VESHQAALDTYVHDIATVKKQIINTAVEKNITDGKLNTLWGQLDYVLYVLDNGQVLKTILGGDATQEHEAFVAGDVVAVLHNDQKYD
jgi:hypothetical protein